MAKMIKKAQNGAKTADSTAYYRNKEYISELKALTATNKPEMDKQFNEKDKAKLNRLRQSKKGKPGYDANGFPLKKKKMKNGGSLSGLKASNKRVGPVDPKGAYTTVQKKTLAGAKGKANLTPDKQLGATKMAKKGMSVKKK